MNEKMKLITAHANCLMVMVNGSFMYLTLHLTIILCPVSHFMCVGVLPITRFTLWFPPLQFFPPNPGLMILPLLIIAHVSCSLSFFSLFYTTLAQGFLNIEIADTKVPRVPEYTLPGKSQLVLLFISLNLICIPSHQKIA